MESESDRAESQARRLLFLVLALSFCSALCFRFPVIPNLRVTLMAPFSPAFSLAGLARQKVAALAATPAALDSREELEWRIRLELAEANAQSLERELQELRGLLKLQGRPQLQGTAASVVLRPSLAGERTLLLDRGTRAGVRKGAVVLGLAGNQIAVVGRVIEAGPNLARVQTLLDPDCRIAASLSDEGGYVYCGPKNGLNGSLDFVPRDRQVLIGEAVSTSADGEFFPAGLALGRIKGLSPGGEIFHNIVVEAALPFGELRHVWVLSRT